MDEDGKDGVDLDTYTHASGHITNGDTGNVANDQSEAPSISALPSPRKRSRSDAATILR